MGSYDVIVLGGGVNGTGAARDCAMRGLRALLLEKADFGVGASGHSSGMIHGGIRYMLTDRKVTALACLDSGYIQRIAPHLLFRIPFLMPFSSRREEATLVDIYEDRQFVPPLSMPRMIEAEASTMAS